MAERQVTVDRDTMPLPKPFLVLATQNPVELEGTFPLPEAQLDRFFLNVQLGYPSEDEEAAILHRFKQDDPLETLQPVITAEQVMDLQQLIRQVHWQPEVERYLLALVRATRAHPAVQLGVSRAGRWHSTGHARRLPPCRDVTMCNPMMSNAWPPVYWHIDC